MLRTNQFEYLVRVAWEGVSNAHSIVRVTQYIQHMSYQVDKNSTFQTVSSVPFHLAPDARRLDGPVVAHVSSPRCTPFRM